MKDGLIGCLGQLTPLQAGFVALAAVGIAAATKAIGEFIASSVQIGIAYESQLSKVQAICGGTAEDMQLLSDKAKEVGKNTVLSSTEAAQALEYMALAGYSTKEMIESLDSVVNLSIASGLDLAKSSDLITDFLTAFNMEVSEATDLADIMAQTSRKTNTSVEQLGEAYKYCAATCGSLNINAVEASSVLGLMANSAIKGSSAGSALNNTLVNLVKPTKKMQECMEDYNISVTNQDGSMKSLRQITDNLRTSLGGLTEAERASAVATLAGKEHMKAIIPIITATDEAYNKCFQDISNYAGASEEMAKTMSNNIEGLLKGINSKWESMKISTFEALKPLISGVLALFDDLMGSLSIVYNEIMKVIGSVTSWLTPIIDVVSRIWQIINETLGPCIESLGSLVSSVLGLVGKLLNWLKDGLMDVLDTFQSVLSPIAGIVTNLVDTITSIINGDWSKAMESFKNLGIDAAQAVVNFFLLIPNIIVDVINAVIDASNSLFGTNFEQIEKFSIDMAALAGENATDISDAYDESGNKIVETYENTFEDVEAAAEDHYAELLAQDEAYQNKLKGLDEATSDYKRQELNKLEKDLVARYEDANGEISLKNRIAIQDILTRKEKQLDQEIAMVYKSAEEEAKVRIDKQEETRKKYEENINKQKDMEKSLTDTVSKESDKRKGFLSSFFDNLSTKWNNIFLGGSSKVKGGYATGTNASGSGWYMAGEHGRELVNLNRNSKVYNTRQTESMLSSQVDMSETNSLLKSLLGVSSEFVPNLREVRQVISDLPRLQKLLNEGY
nr:phage tail tape measure protein [uncultured Cellulosilyticum sp.]